MDSGDTTLREVLKKMAADITNPDSHHLVSASYFDFVDSQRPYTRRYMCPIYVHQDSASNLDFDEQGILLDTFFSPEEGTPAERIHIPYDQIYSVAKSPTGGLYTDEHRLYSEPSKFKMPPIPKPKQ